MSLVGQLSFSKGTLHGLDKYVECKRLVRESMTTTLQGACIIPSVTFEHTIWHPI